jgi:hypothetical protein
MHKVGLLPVKYKRVGILCCHRMTYLSQSGSIAYTESLMQLAVLMSCYHLIHYAFCTLGHTAVSSTGHAWRIFLALTRFEMPWGGPSDS